MIPEFACIDIVITVLEWHERRLMALLSILFVLVWYIYPADLSPLALRVVFPWFNTTHISKQLQKNCTMLYGHSYKTFISCSVRRGYASNKCFQVGFYRNTMKKAIYQPSNSISWLNDWYHHDWFLYLVILQSIAVITRCNLSRYYKRHCDGSNNT